MRRFLPLALLFLLLFCLAGAAGAAAPNGTLTARVEGLDRPQALKVVSLRFNGAAISGEMPGVIVNERTMAPLRLLAEALDAAVEWRPDAEAQVRITRGEDVIDLTLGAPTALVNGQSQELPGGVPATVVTYEGQGYTMVPLRFFSETLGCRVSWDQGSYTASVFNDAYIDPLLSLLDIPETSGRFLVALDAGHGGSAPGASYEAIEEKDLNLAMTGKLRDILAALGCDTVMTREDDRYVGLSGRAALANQTGADVFVSIHCNAAERAPDFQGLYVYHYPQSQAGAAFAQEVQTAACAMTGAVDRRTDTANFVVLRETDMPAVLVETGFMTCSEELSRLADDAYQTRMAQGIAQGVMRYLSGQKTVG